MKRITNRQQEVLSFISNFTAEKSYPPTIRELSDYFNISTKAVQDHIAALQRKGYLLQNQNTARSLKVIVNEMDSRPFINSVPLLGTVAAGRPLLSEENLDGYVTLAEPFIKPGKNYFALRVRGASMRDVGILEGDLAVVEQSSTAIDGQIVVAVIDDAITLKRYFKEAARIRLQPENPDFQAIYCQDVRIVGILSGIVRTY